MPDLIILGASARSAAFSALRAGLQPITIDLFADVDLMRVAPCRKIRYRDYPRGFEPILAELPHVPWMYTGGLENHDALVGRMAKIRPLWGNPPDVLRRVRSPLLLAKACKAAGVGYPDLLRIDEQPPGEERWLIKPYRGAGGIGITDYDPDRARQLPPHDWYLQRFVTGESCSAVYAGSNQGARLLGATRQMVGEAWTRAPRMAYCGSIGPLPLADAVRRQLQAIGDAVAGRFGVRGLFGIDFILEDGNVVVIEVNPRYTASMEMIELATRIPILALHAAAFDEARAATAVVQATLSQGFLGKAILFADRRVIVPRQAPWYPVPASSDLWALPAWADIPPPEATIRKRHPILSVFARGDTEDEVHRRLQRSAAEVYSAIGRTGTPR